MSTFGVVLLSFFTAVGVISLWAFWRIRRMTTKEKKAFFKQGINSVFTWLEDRGLLQPTPAFIPDYLRLYPQLQLLADGYEDIRAETEALLQIKHKLTDVSALGGAYTQSGIHVIQWKSFMFKSGKFIDANCARAPKTAAMLKQIDGLYTAFLSILEPDQYITPHWGYYKGFLRYHLGVVIPNNNANGECWLRVNDDPEPNALRDPAAIEEGEVYYWKNGEGIVFNDNYLHDARNSSDEIRVVLWLDLRRRMSWYLQIFNILCLEIVHREKSVKQIRTNTLIED